MNRLTKLLLEKLDDIKVSHARGDKNPVEDSLEAIQNSIDGIDKANPETASQTGEASQTETQKSSGLASQSPSDIPTFGPAEAVQPTQAAPERAVPETAQTKKHVGTERFAIDELEQRIMLSATQCGQDIGAFLPDIADECNVSLSDAVDACDSLGIEADNNLLNGLESDLEAPPAPSLDSIAASIAGFEGIEVQDHEQVDIAQPEPIVQAEPEPVQQQVVQQEPVPSQSVEPVVAADPIYSAEPTTTITAEPANIVEPTPPAHQAVDPIEVTPVESSVTVPETLPEPAHPSGTESVQTPVAEPGPEPVVEVGSESVHEIIAESPVAETTEPQSIDPVSDSSSSAESSNQIFDANSPQQDVFHVEEVADIVSGADGIEVTDILSIDSLPVSANDDLATPVIQTSAETTPFVDAGLSYGGSEAQDLAGFSSQAAKDLADQIAGNSDMTVSSGWTEAPVESVANSALAGPSVEAGEPIHGDATVEQPFIETVQTPIQTEAIQPEPIQPEPIQPEPIPVEPGQADASHAAPAPQEPVQTEAVAEQAEPEIAPEPESDPEPVEPVQTEPVVNYGTEQDPATTEFTESVLPEPIVAPHSLELPEPIQTTESTIETEVLGPADSGPSNWGAEDVASQSSGEVLVVDLGERIQVNGNDGFDHIDLSNFDVADCQFEGNEIRVTVAGGNEICVEFENINRAVFSGGVEIDLSSGAEANNQIVQDYGDRGNNGDEPRERGDRAERGERGGDRGERGERSERGDRSERGNRGGGSRGGGY